jgi:hypothetical protein
MERLEQLFWVAPNPLWLNGPNKSPLYLLYFGVSNPSLKARKAALEIAGYILGMRNHGP